MTTFAAFAITARLSRLSLWLPLVNPVRNEKPEGDISARSILMLEIKDSACAPEQESVFSLIYPPVSSTSHVWRWESSIAMFAPLVTMV